MFSILQLISLSLFSVALFAEDEKDQAAVSLDTLLVTETVPAINYPLNSPLNATEFDRELIHELGFTRAQDTAGYTPNYNLSDAGANGFADRSSIRGLTNSPIFTTPSVVLYVDDVPYLSSFAYSNQLVGTEAVEVYRGPQGSLFGRNSYAGVINIKSRRPSNQLRFGRQINNGMWISASICWNLMMAFSGLYHYLATIFIGPNPESRAAWTKTPTVRR